MLIFSEDNIIYQVFSIMVSFLCLFSSYYYMYVAAFRFSKEIVDAVHVDEWEPYFMISLVFEIIFVVYFVLHFFKEFTPVGQGDRSRPVR